MEKKQTPKYEFPDEIKNRVRVLLKDFLKEQKISVPELADMLSKEYERPESRTNLLNKFARASFKMVDVIEILDLFGYEVKFDKKHKK